MTRTDTHSCELWQARWLRAVDDGVVDQGANVHVHGCTDCRQYFREMSFLLADLGSLRESTEQLSEVAASPIQHNRPQRIARPLPLLRIAAAIVILAGAAYLAMNYRPETPGSKQIVENPLPVKVDPVAKDVSFKLQGQSKQSYLAVATPSSKSNVEVFWLYPTPTKSGEKNQLQNEKLSHLKEKRQ